MVNAGVVDGGGEIRSSGVKHEGEHTSDGKRKGARRKPTERAVGSTSGVMEGNNGRVTEISSRVNQMREWAVQRGRGYMGDLMDARRGS